MRYAIVGVSTNLIAFLVYLGLTRLSFDPKLAMAFVYIAAATLSYFGNARYTFSYEGRTSSGLIRFVAAHALGFCFNLLLLFVFVDLLAFPHEIVQFSAIFAVAGLLFLLMRYFVFRKREGDI